MDKKNEARFTLQFSRTDPAHRKVIEILNGQGRRSKTPYIVSAVLHYESCGTMSQSLLSSRIDSKMIEDTVRHLLEERELQPGSFDCARCEEKPEDLPKSTKPQDSLEEMGNYGFAAIADTLVGFRVKGRQ
jgi:hypothetical protein